jgi:hypothetical protein
MPLTSFLKAIFATRLLGSTVFALFSLSAYVRHIQNRAILLAFLFSVGAFFLDEFQVRSEITRSQSKKDGAG